MSNSWWNRSSWRKHTLKAVSKTSKAVYKCKPMPLQEPHTDSDPGTLLLWGTAAVIFSERQWYEAPKWQPVTNQMMWWIASQSNASMFTEPCKPREMLTGIRATLQQWLIVASCSTAIPQACKSGGLVCKIWVWWCNVTMKLFNGTP